ncbi:MAG: pantoate--beta-alanine ligase [Methylacidiphilales bacterium]|nr:pantoate--beta-alanine ligase [Candidatus Methylacidiphilales bacterium]
MAEVLRSCALLRAWRDKQKSVVLVPTMGNLHQGHLSLCQQAKKYSGNLVVSIFVNPTQFERSDQYRSYPRTLDADLALLSTVLDETDVVFVPDEKEMYPHSKEIESQKIEINVGGIGQVLEGAFRAGHFSGVATIILKLFHVVSPHRALFGKKDYQQLRVIERLCAELLIPVTIVGAETVRAESGLALSSRNQFLSEQESSIAPLFYATLKKLANVMQQDGDKASTIAESIKSLNAKNISVDYLELWDQQLMRRFDDGDSLAGTNGFVLLGACRMEKVRLLDAYEFNLH